MAYNILQRLKSWFSISSLILFTIALTLGITAGVVVYKVLSPAPWSPLGPYPVQVVTSQGPKLKSPINAAEVLPQIKLGSKAAIAGTKCSKEEVTVKGGYGWRSVVPSGLEYTAATGAPGLRLKGCSKLAFQNVIPPEVDDWARDVINGGQVPAVFLGGCEIPVNPDGKEGVKVCWRSEPFILVLP